MRGGTKVPGRQYGRETEGRSTADAAGSRQTEFETRTHSVHALVITSGCLGRVALVRHNAVCADSQSL
eukprot:15436973-Alexandrium_andersonii.AAC.1